MRASRNVLLSFLPILLVGGSVSAWAQQVQGSFTGTVTDPSGGAIPDVVITAAQEGTGFSRSGTSLSDGSYEIPLLPPGSYKLTAEKAGFEKSVQGPIELLVDQHLKVDIPMKVGSQATTITVEAAPPVLDTQTGAVGTTIERQKVVQLPLNGRNFLQLTLFTPGVAPGTSGSENSTRGGGINVNGLRETMNSFWLDGLNDTSVAVGTYAVTPPIDSVQEFRMETCTYEAKFGTNAGAQVNVVTKSGTNHFHGTAYEYLRNSKLDARNFFDPIVPPFKRNQFGATIGGPVLLPGYDGHDRTFFFTGYEGLRERRDFFEQSRVPTAAESSGNFQGDLDPSCATKNLLLDPLVLLNPQAPLTVPNNDLRNLFPLFPTHAADPVGQAFVNLYPPPNVPNAACGAANYIAQGKRKIDTDSYVARVDHRWGSKNNIFVRYNITSDREFRPFNVDTNLLGYGLNVHDVNHMTGLDWTRVFSPNVINEAKIGYNRWTEHFNNEDEGNPFAQQLGIVGLPPAPSQTGVPRLNFTGYATIGSQTNNPQGGAVNTYEFADTLTQIHGNHTFAYGFDIRPIKRGNFLRNFTIRGQYDLTGVVTGGLVLSQLPPPVQLQLSQMCPASNCTFGNGIADALLGIPQDWINGFQVPISGTGTEYDAFAHDAWKVRRNLTLSLGVRYEYNSLVTDKFDRFSNFDFSSQVCGSPGALLVAGRSAATVECPVLNQATGTLAFLPVGKEDLGSTSENRALQRPDRDNIAPRFGFAWQPFNNSKTAVRGGYGIFYDQTFGDVYFQRASNPPFVQVGAGNVSSAVLSLIQNGTLPLGSGALIRNAFALAAVPLFPRISPFQMDFQDSFVQQWSFNIQRELSGSWLFDVGYVGTRGLRLPRGTDPNQPNIAAGNTRRFPAFPQDFIYTESSGSSVYHALQLKVERHFSRGLAFLGAYTWSKAIDTNSTAFSTERNENFPQNSLNLAAEKGPSDFDFRHRLSLAYVYDLPFGNTVWKSQSSALNYAISGWQLSGIVTAQTGPPFTPQISGNVSCTGETSNGHGTTDRPNLIGNPYPSNQTPNQWILTSAFRDPRRNADGSLIALCAFGNAGRNSLRGPGLADWDFSLIRRLRLTESKALEFRAEMFNIFNRANFETPERDVSSASFGRIFNTVQPLAGLASGGPGDPREIQFALRFIW